MWVMRLEPSEMQCVKAYQKVNWLPAMPELSWKHLLHQNVERAKAKFGAGAFDFWPRGWVLPDQYPLLQAYYASQPNGLSQFPIILKPALQACGNGIRCITGIDQLPSDDPFLDLEF